MKTTVLFPLAASTQPLKMEAPFKDYESITVVGDINEEYLCTTFQQQNVVHKLVFCVCHKLITLNV